jgi:hypothetical protein
VFAHLRGDRQSCGHFIGSGLAALIHSRSLVLVLVLVVVGWWMRRYAPPIWIADMDCRYGATIWCDDMQSRKTEKAKSNTLLAPDVVIRYFTFVV